MPTTTPDADRQHHRARLIRLAVRIVLSIAMLGFLFWQVPEFEASELFPPFHPATAWWLVGAFLTLLVAFALQTERWAQVLRALGHHLPYRKLFSEFLAGQFISNVLPAAVGGDIVRVARLGREIDDHPVAFASVALERLTGWIVLPVISLITLAVTPAYQDLGHAVTVAVVINLVTVAGLFTVLAIAANRRWTDAARTAVGWRRWLGSVHLGIDSIRRHPSTIVGAVLAGASFQVTQCLSVWMTAQALDVHEVTVAAALIFFPPTAIVQNAPVGFGGLGVREGAFVLFFGALGVSDERAIAIGLVGYLITMLASALGAPAFALGGWRRQLDEAEILEEEPEIHGDPAPTAAGAGS